MHSKDGYQNDPVSFRAPLRVKQPKTSDSDKCLPSTSTGFCFDSQKHCQDDLLKNPWRLTWNVINHSGLEDWKIFFLSFHGWFVCSSRSSSRVYDLDPISFLVAKKVNYTTCHRNKGGLPGICSLVSGCQLVRTTLGSWRSRSWSTALGAGLWYSFVSDLDRIKWGGQRRGLNGLSPCPRTCGVFGGGRMMMWWKKCLAMQASRHTLKIDGFELDFRCSPWKRLTRRQRTVPKPEFPESSKCGNCSEIPCPKFLTSRVC